MEKLAKYQLVTEFNSLTRRNFHILPNQISPLDPVHASWRLTSHFQQFPKEHARNQDVNTSMLRGILSMPLFPFIILRAKWRLWRTIQGHLSSLQTCSSRVKVSHLEIQFYWLLLRMINLVVSLCIVFRVYEAEPNNEMRSQVCGQQRGLQRARFKIERNSRK